MRRKSPETLHNLSVKNKLLPFKEAILSKRMTLEKRNVRMESQAADNVISSSGARETRRKINEAKSADWNR